MQFLTVYRVLAIRRVAGAPVARPMGRPRRGGYTAAPDDCVEGLRRCAAMGATTVVLRVQWPGMPSDDALRAIALVGERVLPAVATL